MHGQQQDAAPEAATLQVGPYTLLRELGRGGAAVVYLARRTSPSSAEAPAPDVALKLLPPGLVTSDEARTRFRREFRALSRLDHPNIVHVVDCDVSTDRPWFTMEHVEGHDLRSEATALAALAPGPRFERVHALIVQIARALAHLHDRGLVHRDITPANIRVDPAGRVKLMDFGICHEGGGTSAPTSEVMGTAAWMSPEQISGRPVDARSDLYSLGCVLYLLLTGRRPFAAQTAQGLFDQHLRTVPRPPRDLDARIPAEWDLIARRLLEKEPVDRFASAHHLLHSLGERSAAGGRPLVGRASVTALLAGAIDDLVANGTPAAVLVMGPEGFGTTRLLDHAGDLARARGLRASRSRARPGDRPYGAFLALWQQLRSWGEGDHPVLADAFGGDARTTVERWSVATLFREALVGVGPLVVVLDDLQYLDPASLDLLHYLLRNTAGKRAAPVAWVLGVDGAGTAPTPSRIRNALLQHDRLRGVDLGPLGRADVEEWVVGLVGPGPASVALAERLHAECGGSPAWITEILDGLRADGVITDKGGQLRLHLDAADIPSSRLPLPASLVAAQRERVDALPPDARRVGAIVALARRRVDVDVVGTVAGLDDDALLAALDALVDAHIVTETREGEDDLVMLEYGSLRDVLLETTTADALTEAHRALGEALERRHRRQLGLVVDDLAWHFEHARIWTKAYVYLVQDADRHLSRSSYEATITLLDAALGLEPAARPMMLLVDADRTLVHVHLSRSQALFHLGQTDAALRAAHAAEALARTLGDARIDSRVAAELGTLLRSLGTRLDEAQRQLQRAVSRAEEGGDLTLVPAARYQLGALAWGRRDLAEAERQWRESWMLAERLGDTRATGQGLNGLGILALSRGQSQLARENLEKSAALFEQLGMFGPLAVARVNLVELYANTGSLHLALEMADRTLVHARELHHPQAESMALAYRAQVLVHLLRADDAVTDATEAIRIATGLGTREDEVFARSARAAALLALDRHAEALVDLDALEAQLTQHDPEGTAGLVAAWRATALACLGRPDEARAVLSRAPSASPWPHVVVRTELARGVAELRLGFRSAAITHWRHALDRAEATALRTWQLLAHDLLARNDPDETSRARHRRVASGLARALASNLGADGARTFLDHPWGGSEGPARG